MGVRQSTIDKVSCDLKICLQQLEKKKREIDRLETDLERCRSKCSQSGLQIQANKAVIAKLTEQLELQAKMIAKKQAEFGEQMSTHQYESTNQANSPVPKGQYKMDTNDGRLSSVGEREVNRKKSTMSLTRPQVGTKNVEFLLDDDVPTTAVSSRMARINLDGEHNDLYDHNLKNHLFTHIKEKPTLKEVNFRTSQKAKVGTNNRNVMASKRIFS